MLLLQAQTQEHTLQLLQYCSCLLQHYKSLAIVSQALLVIIVFTDVVPSSWCGLLPPGGDCGGTPAQPSASQLTGDDVSVCRLEFSQVLSY